jgi:hypothetical protein
MGFV